MTKNSRPAVQSGDGYFLSYLLKSLWRSPIKSAKFLDKPHHNFSRQISVLLLSGNHHRFHFSAISIKRLLKGLWKSSSKLTFTKEPAPNLANIPTFTSSLFTIDYTSKYVVSNSILFFRDWHFVYLLTYFLNFALYARK